MASETDLPSVARLLAAGQRGEVVHSVGVFGATHASNIEGKGRGLVAANDVSPGDLLLLEPALASAATYEDLASALVRIVGPSLTDAEGPVVSDVPPAGGPSPVSGRDDVLLAQLLDLSVWGEAPASVNPLLKEEAESFMRRLPRRADNEARVKALQTLGVETIEDESFALKLHKRLTLVAKANAFRSAIDPLGAIAWHALSPREQLALSEANPALVPSPLVSFFLRAALCNHSERPNATWFVAGGVIIVRAAAAIREGDEVLFSYWPDVDAADAVSHGLYESFGGVSSAIACAGEELDFSDAQLKELHDLKRLSYTVASALAEAGASGNVAGAFDSAAATLMSELARIEKVLPKDLRAFLEPRCIHAQVTLQQAAILVAQGDGERGEKLRKLGLLRLQGAFRQYTQPWSTRILLRLLFALKGSLRPAPSDLAKSTDEGSDFSVQLARQARPQVDEIWPELQRAVEAVYGEKALVSAVLSKCAIPWGDE